MLALGSIYEFIMVSRTIFPSPDNNWALTQGAIFIVHKNSRRGGQAIPPTRTHSFLFSCRYELFVDTHGIFWEFLFPIQFLERIYDNVGCLLSDWNFRIFVHFPSSL